MRRRLLLVLLPLAALATPLAVGSAPDRGGEVRVACANDRLTQVSFRVEPKHCIFLRRGADSYAGAAPARRLEWSHWGRPHARGEGTGFVNMLGATPIKVRLSKPKTICGHRVYSKVKVRYPELDAGGDYPLDTCPR